VETTVNNDNDNQKTRAPFFIYCGIVRVESGYEADGVIMRNNNGCYGLWVLRRRCLVGWSTRVRYT